MKEYLKFENEGFKSELGYQKLRELFVLTHGKNNDDLSDQINSKIGKYNNINSKGILGDLSNSQIKTMVDKMKIDGFYEFDISLSDSVVENIYNYALKTPVSFLEVATKAQEASIEKVVFDEKNPISPRYQYNSAEVFACSELQNLIFDQSLLAFAQEYLGCKPILDLVAFWWSAPFSGKGKSAAAQMYHFDLDRIKFMKFFFYITDVTTHTGPHCYVKGSQGKLPVAINRDGRFEDSEIELIYGAENLIEICGKKGSIIAVDTRGFHKGKELISGKRLLFQIQFTNSLFGQSYDAIDSDIIDSSYSDLFNNYNHSYNNIC
ncbi:phytanoyl-CoA dioxygenase family protein [Flavobacterium psychrophilum]|uniref:hypothetical protein n=1 Tax=Flavobacterium psychrophilum TaxID=96345 RepID=UPI001D08D9F2|nr:hypothetical protein [Flavobacterium psychrophilum]EKT3956845.1 hypothetical protein [Flavobacterium psychrophilum]EKT4508452.1 hypothetical protein [Flavobacterium psychrophilum]MCB6088583.1 hypothetical protein [Flavobacterium psychrophilum]